MNFDKMRAVRWEIPEQKCSSVMAMIAAEATNEIVFNIRIERRSGTLAHPGVAADHSHTLH